MSIVIPTYNCAEHISDAIQSVVAQTYHNWETIIVDDGSTDNTRQVLGPYLGRVQYHYQENRGPSAARNVGIRQARGQLIAFLDADDYWLPEKLEMQVEALDRHPGVPLCFTDYLVVENDRVVRQSGFDGRADHWLIGNAKASQEVVRAWIFDHLLESNYVHTSSVVLRREVVKEVGLFDEAFRVCQDYDLWLRIAARHPVICVNRSLSGYRYRRESVSGPAEGRDLRYDCEVIPILEGYLRKESVPSKHKRVITNTLSRRCWWQGWRYFSNNNLHEARALFLRGVRYRPLDVYHWIYLGASLLPVPIIERLRKMKRDLA